MTSSSLAGMHIQFRTLTFHSRPEEQLQEYLHLKKSVTSLSAAIRVLGSPLEPHPESDLAINLYSGSTLIANMDESDRQINFNNLKKSATSLSSAIRALDSTLGPHPESDLAIVTSG
jgi:HD-like signal output (HDOD) protein